MLIHPYDLPISVVGVIGFLAFLVARKMRYWEDRNVPRSNTYGDQFAFIQGQTLSAEMLETMYDEVPPHHRYLGIFLYQKPILLLRSPSLIKKLLVSYSKQFKVPKNIIWNSSDYLWRNTPFCPKESDWSTIRQILSPLVNEIPSVKVLFPRMGSHVHRFVSFVKGKKDNIVEIEAIDVMFKILNDIAADVAMSSNVDSFRNPTNPFIEVAEENCDLNNSFKKLVISLNLICPCIVKKLGLSIDGNAKRFFLQTVKNIIKKRDKPQSKINDMLGFLVVFRKAQRIAKTAAGSYGNFIKTLTDEEITSYVFAMFFGIVGALPTPLACLIWELSTSTKIQKRLREECDNTPAENRPVKYQDIVDMKYLDMVVNETLRKWPPVVSTDRLVTEPYTIEPELPHEKPVPLTKGDIVMVPIWAIHRDSKYYKKPEKFDPERFSPENRHKIDPNAFIPFGIGPRQCLGAKISTVIMKVVVYHLIRSFEIVSPKKVVDPTVMLLLGNFPMRLKLRKKE